MFGTLPLPRLVWVWIKMSNGDVNKDFPNKKGACKNYNGGISLRLENATLSQLLDSCLRI